MNGLLRIDMDNMSQMDSKYVGSYLPSTIESTRGRSQAFISSDSVIRKVDPSKILSLKVETPERNRSEDYYVFPIRVKVLNIDEYTVYHRYSDFLKLNNEIKKKNIKELVFGSFPKKTYLPTFN